MDIQKQIEKESKWYESPQAFKEGANFTLGLCQKEIAELKEQLAKLRLPLIGIRYSSACRVTPEIWKQLTEALDKEALKAAKD